MSMAVIMQLFNFAECITNKRLHIKLDDHTFAEKSKSSISNESIKSLLVSLIQSYRKKSLSLTKFYGNLHVGNIHYVSVFIDTNIKTVHSLDPLGQDNFQINVNTKLMRKWIAKSFSIIDYYFEQKKKKSLYFGSEDMQVGSKFLENNKKNVRSGRK